MLNELMLENTITRKVMAALKGQKISKIDAEQLVETYVFKPGINPEIAISIKEDIIKSLLKSHKIISK